MELQNDYTTKEQSYRLLGLGVPKISANLYYDDEDEVQLVKDKEHELIGKGYFPCWSVGRLVEIMKICAKPKEQAIMVEEMLYCKDLVELLVYMIEANKQVIDFSKLDE